MCEKKWYIRVITLIVAVLCISSLGVTALATTVNPFKDVKQTDWYFDSVLWAVENEITAGRGEGVFAPGATCTRAEAVTFLWRCAGKPAPKSIVNTFSDVKKSDWYFDPVLWAAENGITAGKGDGKFAPADTCTRAEIVTFLWRLAGKPVPETTSNPFNDVNKSNWYHDSVLWAAENNITAGKGEGKFAPTDTCTRAEIVTFLYRYEKDASQPSQPDTPAKPEAPDTPSTPVGPDEPDVPDTPSTPSTPSTPTVPGNPSKPGVNKPQDGNGVGGEYETERDYS